MLERPVLRLIAPVFVAALRAPVELGDVLLAIARRVAAKRLPLRLVVPPDLLALPPPPRGLTN